MKGEFIEKRLGGAETVWNRLRYDSDGIIEASAGTGKTYALESIVLKLLYEKRIESVENLLLVTFTEKAAGELKDRIRAILDEAGILPANFDEVTICTIHAFCRELLSEYAFENGVPMSMEIRASEDAVRRCAVRHALLGEEFDERFSAVFAEKMAEGEFENADELVEDASAALSELVSGVVKKEHTPIACELAYLASEELKRLKTDAELFTFDDLVLQAYAVIGQEAARERMGEKSALLDKIRRRYRIALVDEFQDTDRMQWTIFKSLFSSRVNVIEGDGTASPRRGFLLVVGDPKQAIYGFRGADIATYLQARKEIREGQAVQSLACTYRSTRELVDAFNHFFGRTPWFSEVTEDGEEQIIYQDVVYPEGNARFAGLEDLTHRAAVTLLESLPNQLDAPKRNNCGYGNREKCLPQFMRMAAREMHRLHNLKVAYTTCKTDADKREMHAIDYNEMCVLVRTAKDAEVVREILSQEGVPCTWYKERGIFAAEEAEMLIVLFDFLAAPSRRGSLAALLLTPLFNVHPSELEECLLQTDERWSRLFDEWQGLCKTRQWGVLFERVMAGTSLAHPRADDMDFDRRWSATRQILDELLVRGVSTARTAGDLAATLRQWRAGDQAGEENAALRQIENESPSVQIMTMHAAKGLEFRAVFIAYGFSAPRSRSRHELAEERRLLYVALTRAEFKLYLPWSHWATHMEGKASTTAVGIGSQGAPLYRTGYLAQGIQAHFAALGQNPDDEVVSLERSTFAAEGKRQEGGAPPNASVCLKAPRIYDVADVRDCRLHCDSFTSMKDHNNLEHVLPEHVFVTDEDEQMDVPEADGAEVPPYTSLLPRTSLAGTVFHEIMHNLCAADEAKGQVGFAIGCAPRDEALAIDGPLINVIRRVMRANALANRTDSEGDSTEQTLARMVWNALNTPIQIGARQFYLKDIDASNRLAEVSFAIDEGTILGEDLATRREGVFNGAIDLLVRPDGVKGPVYFIDWKTNYLASYSRADIIAAMQQSGYPLQYKLYTLAATRWLGSTALAGLAYLFVRGGERTSSCGVYSLPLTPDFLTDCVATLRRAILSQPNF